MTNWNFSRLALAEKYLDIFSTGLFSNLAIIEARRKGKTFFLLQDLAPLSLKRKYIPIYANLWQNTNAPHEGLILAFQEALKSLSKKSAIGRLLNSEIKKTTISNELLGKMEIEFAESPTKASSQELMLLEQLLNELTIKAGKKTILLLVDEVQHLATSAVFEPLTYALRTMLDKRQGAVKAIFTGSSRHYMDLLFNESQAPFYHFVERVPFPDLGSEFIHFLVNKMDKEFGVSVDFKKLSNAFDKFDKSPYWMIKFVGYLLSYGTNFNESLDYILQLIEKVEGFDKLAKQLKPIDKLVYIAITNKENIFSKVFLSRVEKETEVKGIPANVQRSLKRLSSKQLISLINKGEYHIEKPGFKQYLENSEKV